MSYLKLKITGAQLMHGRLPGEEFYVRADDNSGRPVNALWGKRLAEEAQHSGGYVTVLEQVTALPTGTNAIDEPAGSPGLPPMGARPLLQQTQDTGAIETRIMEAMARALNGIRSEIGRLPKPQTGVDGNTLLQRVQGMLENERLHAALVADAWRVRMALPPGWQAGEAILITHNGETNYITPPPLIEAYAARNHHGDVGSAAMELTETDLAWQAQQAERLRTIVGAS